MAVSNLSTTTVSVTSTTTDNVTSEDETEINRATEIINNFMPLLLILAGSVCNVLIILGMRTKNFRSLSTSVYMKVMAFNDLTSLIILLIAHWLHVNFPKTIVRSEGSDFLCKFFNFYGWGQADVGIIITSAMTADRAYVILRPMTRADLVKRAKIVIAVCVFVVVVKEFHFWFSSVMVDLSRKDRLCDVSYTSHSYNNFYINYWPWIDMAFVTLCFVVMVISNCIIICHVRKNRKGRQLEARGSIPGSVHGKKVIRTSSTMTIHGGNYQSVANQVTRMLLLESLMLILLSYPFSVHLIVTSHIDDLNKDPAKKEANALAFNVVFYLLYANKCVNFMVYCMAGKKFRQAIMREVLCRCKCGRFQFGKQKLPFDSDGSQRTRTMKVEVGEKEPEQEMDVSANSIKLAVGSTEA